MPAVPPQPPVYAHLAQAQMDSALLACLSWALQPFLIPPAPGMSSDLPLWFSAFCAAHGSCQWQRDEITETNTETKPSPRLEKNLSPQLFGKHTWLRTDFARKALRGVTNVVCRLDGATQQLHLACRLPINPQALLRHTGIQRGADDQSVCYSPVPPLACQAMIKSNWIQPSLGGV